MSDWKGFRLGESIRWHLQRLPMPTSVCPMSLINRIQLDCLQWRHCNRLFRPVFVVKSIGVYQNKYFALQNCFLTHVLIEKSRVKGWLIVSNLFDSRVWAKYRVLIFVFKLCLKVISNKLRLRICYYAFQYWYIW